MAATIVNAGKMNTGPNSQANMPPPKQKKVNLIDETNLLICINNNIDKDAVSEWDLEFEGYYSKGVSMIEAEGRPLYCSQELITED